jgi:hypothetical protein
MSREGPMSVRDIVRDYGPLLGLAGVALTLWVNGQRTERERRRASHSRAIEAVVAYLQMPYAIRRRRSEPENASAERVRLTEAFRNVQKELASCEALMRTDRDSRVRDAYADLIEVLRRDAGAESSRSWKTSPITSDAEVGLQDVHDALARVRNEQRRFEQIAAESTLPLRGNLLLRQEVACDLVGHQGQDCSAVCRNDAVSMRGLLLPVASGDPANGMCVGAGRRRERR